MNIFESKTTLGRVKKIHRKDRLQRKLKFNRIKALRKTLKSTNNNYKEYFHLLKLPYLPPIKINLTRIALLLAVIAIVTPLTFSSIEKKFNKYIISASSTANYEDIIFNDQKENVEKFSQKDLTSSLKNLDKRVYVLDEYFRKNDSPLYGTAHSFVEACDKYGAPKDCITLAAIAKHETDLCKYHNSAEMHNCIGWGGGGIYRMSFPSFEEMIDTSTKILVQQYSYEMMVDPSLMESVFCGPQAECSNWGNRVKILMNEIDNFGVSLGVGKLTDLR